MSEINSINTYSSTPSSDPSDKTVSAEAQEPSTETGETQATLSRKDQETVNKFLNSPLISDESKTMIENSPEKFAKGEQATEKCIKRSKKNLDRMQENEKRTEKSYSAEPDDKTQTSKQSGDSSSSPKRL